MTALTMQAMADRLSAGAHLTSQLEESSMTKPNSVAPSGLAQCTDCQQDVHEYATTDSNEAVCYPCCAARDLASMRETGRAILYLTRRDRKSGELSQGMRSPDIWEVTNWPGTLRFYTGEPSIGRHNIARIRRDVWFRDREGAMWHAVQYGEHTDIVHARRIKG